MCQRAIWKYSILSTNLKSIEATQTAEKHKDMFNMLAIREVQIGTTLRCHITAVRMAIISKTSDNSR